MCYATFLCSYLKHLLGLLGSFIVGRVPLQIILILLAVNPLMNCLAEKTIGAATDLTPELIHLEKVWGEGGGGGEWYVRELLLH